MVASIIVGKNGLLRREAAAYLIASFLEQLLSASRFASVRCRLLVCFLDQPCGMAGLSSCSNVEHLSDVRIVLISVTVPRSGGLLFYCSIKIKCVRYFILFDHCLLMTA